MRQRDAGPFRVFPCNWMAVRWWLACQSQLRAAPGGVLGFDYSGCEQARRWLGLPDPDPWDFEAFRILERTTTSMINERDERRG